MADLLEVGAELLLLGSQRIFSEDRKPVFPDGLRFLACLDPRHHLRELFSERFLRIHKEPCMEYGTGTNEAWSAIGRVIPADTL